MSPEREDSVRRELGPDVSELHGAIVRERADPREGDEPVPLWLITLMGVLLFWGGWYLAEYSGGYRALVLDPRPEARFPARAAGEEKQEDPVALGRKLYTAHCVSCHQQGGQGVPGQYPPLDGSRWVTGSTTRLKRILLHGLNGEIEVQGEVYNGNMPAFGPRLSDEHLGAVLTYVRQAWSNAADPVPPESVAATREATKERTDPWTAPEVDAITEPDWTPPPPGEEPGNQDSGHQNAGDKKTGDKKAGDGDASSKKTEGDGK